MRTRIGLFIAALALPGCDVLDGIEGFLNRPTQAEIAGTALVLESETGCTDVGVRAVSAAGVDEGALSASDCPLAGAYADFWLVKTSAACDISVTMTSDEFAPYVALFPVDLQAQRVLTNEGVVDRNDDNDGRAAFTSRITAGLYVVVTNSVFEGDTGAYALDVRRGG